MKSCENCEEEHDGEYGSGRFCSSKCARGFSTKAKREEINEKVKNSLTGSGNKKVVKICVNCKIEFIVNWKKRNQKNCSRSCSAKLRWKDAEYRKNISISSSKNAKKLNADPNSNFGWQTRKKFEASYPEKIAHKFLNNYDINFLTEYKVGKYFIDIAIIENKIAIEIDGQQHEKPERKEIDKRKDKHLKENGWKVFRIKFPNKHFYVELKNVIDKQIK